MPEISVTVYVRGRQPRMILSVSFSSLPDMSQNSAGSFLFLFQFFFTSRSVHFFSPYHQLELPCTRFLPPLFTSVPHMEAFCRATPALRHWLTYRARFSLRVCAVLCRPLCWSRVCAHPLLSGLFILQSYWLALPSFSHSQSLSNQNYTTRITIHPRSYDQNTKLWNILFSVWDLNNVTVMFQIIF